MQVPLNVTDSSARTGDCPDRGRLIWSL